MDAIPNLQDLANNCCLEHILLKFKLRKKPANCIFELYIRTCFHWSEAQNCSQPLAWHYIFTMKLPSTYHAIHKWIGMEPFPSSWVKIWLKQINGIPDPPKLWTAGIKCGKYSTQGKKNKPITEELDCALWEVTNCLCEHASSAFIFANTGSDQICFASSEYFRK